MKTDVNSRNQLKVRYREHSERGEGAGDTHAETHYTHTDR